jgi:hypothetical protein
MKQLIIAILIIPLLGMIPPEEKEERKVVEHYITTLLNTDDENIKDVFSLMKITKEHDEKLMNKLTDFLLDLKKQLKGHKYKILTYCQARKILRKKQHLDPFPSEIGATFYIYDLTKGIVLYKAAVVVNGDYGDCEIISFASEGENDDVHFIYL